MDFIEEGYALVIRIGQLNDSTLIAKNLGTITRHLYASPAYLANNSQPKIVGQLKEHQLLVMNPISNDSKLNLVSLQHGDFTVNFTPRLLVNDFMMVKQSFIDGLGIAVLPDYMCRKDVSMGGLIKILPEWNAVYMDVYALYPRHRAKIPSDQ